MKNNIQHSQLKAIFEVGGVKEVKITAQSEGFSLSFATLCGEKILLSKSGKTRFFKKLETVLAYLITEMGATEASIKFHQWRPNKL